MPLTRPQYQTHCTPNIQFLCHILATLRKSGKEFCALYIRTKGVAAFRAENLPHRVNVCQTITAPLCNLYEVWSAF